MSPHGHHHGGGHHFSGHHHRAPVQHHQHHHHPHHHYRHAGSTTVFVGGPAPAPGYYANSYYGGNYYWGPRRAVVYNSDASGMWDECLCVKNKTAYWVYCGSLVVALIIAISLVASVKTSCPTGCVEETCIVLYYDAHQDDTVSYQCSCDDGGCADTQTDPAGGAQLAFGILFFLYFGFGLFGACRFANCAASRNFRLQQNTADVEQQRENNNDNGIVMSPIQPGVDLDTTRPFAVNPQYVTTAQPPASPFSTYPAAPQYSAIHATQFAAVPTAPPESPPLIQDASYTVVEAVPIDEQTETQKSSY